MLTFHKPSLLLQTMTKPLTNVTRLTTLGSLNQ